MSYSKKQSESEVVNLVVVNVRNVNRYSLVKVAKSRDKSKTFSHKYREVYAQQARLSKVFEQIWFQQIGRLPGIL